MNHHHSQEAQDYQSVGQLAPEAEQALTHQKGWDGIAAAPPRAVDPIDQLQSHDTSFWSRRANTQTLATTDDTNYAADFFSPVNSGADIPPMAGYALGQGFTQTPTAATDPASFARSAERSSDPGIIAGADASDERSGNTGVM